MHVYALRSRKSKKKERDGIGQDSEKDAEIVHFLLIRDEPVKHVGP